MLTVKVEEDGLTEVALPKNEGIGPIPSFDL